MKFVDGFASPPHIHNISYRGLVIGGLLHNDDPDAAPMWMPAGSYWTQPAGEAHITAARGVSVAYVETQDGPYLVRPTDQAFDNGERPVNIDATNLVWLGSAETPRVEASPEGERGAEVSFLWGEPEPGRLSGALVKLPPGFRGVLRSEGALLRAVVVQGEVHRHTPRASDAQTLDPGSYFASAGETPNHISSGADAESLIYVRTRGRFTIAPD